MPISVSIVEDNDKLRGTLARVLNRADGFRCVSHYASAEDALKDLPQVQARRRAHGHQPARHERRGMRPAVETAAAGDPGDDAHRL